MSKFYALRNSTNGVQDRDKRIPGIAEQKIFISEVQFGETVYPFQQNIEAYFVPSISEEPYCFCVDDFLPYLYGKGKTPQEARIEWEFRFHLKFQELYTKCDFERSEDEIKLWSVFEKIVDIPAYRAITPLSFQVTGKFVDNPGIPKRYREIEWIDGTKEIVDSRLCPRESITIQPGQYFEATVLRGYHDNKILKILSVHPVDYQDFTGEEIGVFLNSLPTSKELPDSTRWK